MSASEAALLRVAYRDRVLRYAPLHDDHSPSSDTDSVSCSACRPRAIHATLDLAMFTPTINFEISNSIN